MERFVDPTLATRPVAGRAVASLGLARVEVAGADAPLAEDGSFSPEVAVLAGLETIPIVAHDDAGHARQAHRSRIAAPFLAEGTLSRDAASMVLTDQVLEAMGASLAGEIADLDLAAEIMARSPMSQDDQCTTWPAGAAHASPELELMIDANAELWLSIRIPDLWISFTGECSGLFSTIPVEGEMGTTVQIYSRLTPAAGQDCVRRFDHTAPWVGLEGFWFDVWGAGGPLQNLAVDWASDGRDVEAADQLQTQIAAEADATIGERVQDIAVFDRRETMTLLDVPIDLHLCLTDLRTEAGVLRAVIGGATTGPGGRSSPGAPLTQGALPAPAAGELLLDANLVAQLLHAAWAAGGLSSADMEPVSYGLLALLSPDLDGRHPTDADVNVSIDGELPPVVRAAAGGAGDLEIAIGDLMIALECEGEQLFRFGTRLDLVLELVPEAGVLRPTVTATAEPHLLEEIADVDDAFFEDLIADRVEEAAPALLGDATIALPAIEGAGSPADVTADPGGRYLHVSMQ